MNLEKSHPLVPVVYLATVVGLMMCTFNLMMAGIGFVMALATIISKKKYSALKTMGVMMVMATIFLVVVQPLFSHKGSTAIFYVNDMAVTLENVVFGVVGVLMLVGVCGYFFALEEAFDQERIMYLFGRISPRLGLLVSMTLRVFGELRDRYEQIKAARCFIGKNENTLKEKGVRIGTLTEWSLECSMEKAMAMEARGYGKGKRTSFHMYHFRLEDGIKIGIILSILAICGLGIIKGSLRVAYFPAMDMKAITRPDALGTIVYILYGILCGLGINVKNDRI